MSEKNKKTVIYSLLNSWKDGNKKQQQQKKTTGYPLEVVRIKKTGTEPRFLWIYGFHRFDFTYLKGVYVEWVPTPTSNSSTPASHPTINCLHCQSLDTASGPMD